MNVFQPSVRTPFWLVLLLLLAHCGGSAEHVNQAPVAVDPLVAGRTIYIKRCASCHNHDGTGTLRKRPYAADFNRPDGVLLQSDAALTAAVMDGKKGTYGTMPAFRPILKEEEVRAVLAYIRHTFQKAPAVDVAPAAQEPSPVRSP